MEILRHHSRRGIKLWYLDNGARSPIKSDHCNTILLMADIFDTITNWGQEILEDPAPYNNRFYQSFIVLSYCRMLHDLHTGYAGSKREGAEWAKTALDPSWSELIDGAWDGRPNPAHQVQQPADSQDFEITLKFVKYVMNKSRLYITGK